MTDNEAGLIRVAVIDDHPVVSAGTAAIIEQAPDMTLVGMASTLAEAQPILIGEVDVLLLDLRLGEESGFSLLTDPAARVGHAPAIVVVTAYDYPQYVDAALRLGAAGYVLKTAPVAELLDAIRRAAGGKLAFSVRPGSAFALSQREREVVGAVADGLSNDEIASRLGIAPKTVESHLRRLFERFSVASRTELATRAIREAWLEVPVSSRR